MEVTRRRRSAKPFAPTGSARQTTLSWRMRLALGVVPLILFLAHCAFGVNQPAASLWFMCILAVLVVIGLSVPTVRQGLFDVRPVWPVAALFALTLAVGLFSLTPLTPGGPHPIWEWAGVADGSSSVNRVATLLELIKLCGLGCAFVLGCMQGARSSQARGSVDVVLAIGAIYTIFSVLMFVSGAQIMVGSRLSGGFLSANSGAAVFGLLSVIALGALLRRWRQSGILGTSDQLSRLAISIGYLLVFLTALVLTASRMGLAATVVASAALLIWEVFSERKGRIPMLVIAGTLFVVGGLILLNGGDTLWSRLGEVNTATLIRGEIFSVHWKAFLDSPLFGYGLGSFSDINSELITPSTYANLWSIRAAHNVYLQWLEEAGIVGASPMFALIAVIIGLAIWRMTRVKSGATLLRGLIAANLVLLVHGTTDYALQVPSIAAFWAFLLGLQFAFGSTRSGG